MKALEIGATSRDGLLEITDTNWDSNGTMRVTVRELVGGYNSWAQGLPIRRMRALARRALPEYYQGQTRKSPEVNRVYSQGCWHITFAVSRND
jgi:hypothetical protein